MKSKTYTAKVTKGKISLPDADRQEIAQVMQRMEGKFVCMTLAESKKPRSVKQNAFYWGSIVPAVHVIFESAGNNMHEDEVHEYLKEHVGKLVKFIRLNGENYKVVMSSTKLNTMQWEEYMDKIRVWASENELQLPYPNESLPAIKGERHMIA